jgi:drug/metabolite transporter (DMT)-like permease
MMGASTTMTSTLRWMANKHCEASQLAVYQYLSTPFQLFFDLLIFHNVFTQIQVFGLAIMFVVYSLKIKKSIDKAQNNYVKF